MASHGRDAERGGQGDSWPRCRPPSASDPPRHLCRLVPCESIVEERGSALRHEAGVEVASARRGALDGGVDWMHVRLSSRVRQDAARSIRRHGGHGRMQRARGWWLGEGLSHDRDGLGRPVVPLSCSASLSSHSPLRDPFQRHVHLSCGIIHRHNLPQPIWPQPSLRACATIAVGGADIISSGHSALDAFAAPPALQATQSLLKRCRRESPIDPPAAPRRLSRPAMTSTPLPSSCLRVSSRAACSRQLGYVVASAPPNACSALRLVQRTRYLHVHRVVDHVVSRRS